MENTIVYVLIGLVVVVVSAFVLDYGLNAIVVSSLRPISQVVARDISVGSEWVEVRPESLMKAHNKMWQTVFLSIEGYVSDSEDEDLVIELQNGTVVEPEIQVVDEYDRSFDLQDTVRVGNLVGFWPKESSAYRSRYPPDRLYSKIRIRSENPIVCSYITWENKRPK